MSRRAPSLPKSVWREIVAEPTAREFLIRARSEFEARGHALSFSAIARRAGFASRSFPREVFTGTRRLTLDTARAFALALRFPEPVTRAFQARVAADRIPRDATLEGRATRARALALRKLADRPSPSANAFVHPEFSRVLVALGSPEVGATLSEIVSRTRLSILTVEAVLRDLAHHGLAQECQGRWIARESHLFFEKIARSEYFARHYQRRLQLAGEMARQSFKREDALFWEVTFSANSQELPKLRAKLRTLLNDFVAQSECAEGDRVFSASSAFLPLG